MGKPELELNSALGRLITAGLPFRQLGGGDSKSDQVEGSQNVKFPLAGARTNTSIERGSMFCPERDRVMTDYGTKATSPLSGASSELTKKVVRLNESLVSEFRRLYEIAERADEFCR